MVSLGELKGIAMKVGQILSINMQSDNRPGNLVAVEMRAGAMDFHILGEWPERRPADAG